MESHKTSAFVFRSIPFRDFDKRVILLSRDFGKITAIAHRAQRSQKRFGAGLESLTLLSVIYQEKSSSSLVQLQEVAILDSFLSLKKSVKKMAYGSYFLEILSEVMRDNESLPQLFDFLHAFLKALEKTKEEELLARLFEARLLPKIGYQPILKQCLRCKISRDLLPAGLSFSLDSGGILCSGCLRISREAVQKVSKEAILYLDHMISQEKSLSANVPLGRELKTFLPSFLFHHLGKRLKSYDFIEQVVGE